MPQLMKSASVGGSQWLFGSPRNSQDSVYTDYRYNSLPLAPAGRSTEVVTYRAEQGYGKNLSRHPQDMIGPRLGDLKTFDTEICASHGRVDPGLFDHAAGQQSANAVTSIHQNLHDVEVQIDRSYPDPRAAAKRRVKEQKQGNRLDNLCLDNSILIERRRGAGEFRQNPRTDPITHFRHEKVHEAGFEKSFKQFKRCRKAPHVLLNSHDQTWTWQSHQGRAEAMKEKENMERDPDFMRNAKARARDVGDLVTCRGERVYNLCGAQDMLPAGIYEFIKCDVPPTRTHVAQNDRKHFPVCGRVEQPKWMKKEFNQSDQVWKIMRGGAYAEETLQMSQDLAVEMADRRAKEREVQSARAVLQTTPRDQSPPRPTHFRRLKAHIGRGYDEPQQATASVKSDDDNDDRGKATFHPQKAKNQNSILSERAIFLKEMQKHAEAVQRNLDAKYGRQNENPSEGQTVAAAAPRERSPERSPARAPPAARRSSSVGSVAFEDRPMQPPSAARRSSFEDRPMQPPSAARRSSSVGGSVISESGRSRSSVPNNGAARRASSVGSVAESRGSGNAKGMFSGGSAVGEKVVEKSVQYGGAMRRSSSVGSLADGRRSVGSAPGASPARSPAGRRSLSRASSFSALSSTQWR